ncbi:hypothetical protein ABK040_015254 [Willaertia magna]
MSDAAIRQFVVGDYLIEYAKSNRSTCILTKRKIEKNALRIGIFEQSKFFDGIFPIWYNFEDWVKDEKLFEKFKQINNLLVEKDLRLYLNKLNEYANQRVITLCDITMQINEEL